MRPDNSRAKSYVFHEDECFFISTIERDSSMPADPPSRIYETIVWEYDWKMTKRGGLLYQDGSSAHNLEIHFEMCRQLHASGVYLDP